MIILLTPFQSLLQKNSDIRKNSIFLKHFNFIITDLFFCWVESRNQFIAVSMSKRDTIRNLDIIQIVFLHTVLK